MVNYLTNRSPSFYKAVMLAKRSSLSNSLKKLSEKTMRQTIKSVTLMLSSLVSSDILERSQGVWVRRRWRVEVR